jgi:eukaryotic-like serine/threonine-protein kinase
MATVAQNVTGSGNLFTGTGDVYQVSYHLDQPTAEDRRNLANLLGHVKRTWITDVLEHSVHEAALLELGMRLEAGAVEHPWERVLEAPAEPGGVLPSDRSIGQVFEDVGRLLLILGEPGSGKTTTLLTLARECVRQAERDPTAPVPVVLSLSTWAESRSSIHDWLVSELGARYFVGRPLARRWLEQSRLLLFLDGLDEVTEDRRAGCVEAIHAFVKAHGVPGIVLCCRSREYRALPVRLKLGGAVLLLPLVPEQVGAYLDAAGPELDGLRGALAHNAELRELAGSPLMLGIMTLAFCGAPPEALRFDDTATPADLRDRIFAVYVDRMFARRWRDQRSEARKEAEGSLRWLASGMAAQGQSVFSVELLQPACLTSRKQLLAYTLVSRVLATVILMTIVCGLMGLLNTLPTSRLSDAGQRAGLLKFLEFLDYLGLGVVEGIATGLLCFVADLVRIVRSQTRLTEARRVRTFAGLLLYTLMGIGGCLVAVAVAGKVLPLSDEMVFLGAFPAALIFAFFFGAKHGRGDAAADIGSAGVLGWQWKTAFTKAALGGLLGATGGLLFILLMVLIRVLLVGESDWPCAIGTSRACESQYLLRRFGSPYFVAFFAVLGGAVGFLFGGWRFQVPPIDLRPGHRHHTRFKSALKGALFSGGLGALVGALLQVVLSPTTTTAPSLLLVLICASVFSGVIAFLWLGGIDLILLASLRLVVAYSGVAPLHLRRFLDQAVGLVFLQRAGSGYMFIHRLLLDHFAAARVVGVPSAPGSFRS